PGLVEKQEWTYDDAHNLANRTTVGGATQTFTYDNRNRKTGMSWDNNPDWASFDYWEDGRLKTAQNGNSTVYRDYDAAGRLNLDRQTVTGIGTAVDVNHAYDDDGKDNHLWTVPNLNYDYTFSYDGAGRFEKIVSGSVAFQYYYDAASNEIQRRNYLSNPDVDQFYNRDNINRIWRREVKKGATLLSREDYGYDSMNRLVSTTREDNRQDQFAYWWDSELLGVNYLADPTPTPSPPPPPTPTPPGGQVAEPTFNPGGGNIYPSHSRTVTIFTTTSGAQIRYTTDQGDHWGTIPNNGTVNVAPNPEQILTAIAFKSGMADSDPHSEEYYYDSGRVLRGDTSASRQKKGTARNHAKPQLIDDDPLSNFMQLVNPGGVDTPPLRTVVYNYDGAGNRTSVGDTLFGNTTYTPNALNQYSAITATSITHGREHEIYSYHGPYDTQSGFYVYLNDEHLVSVSSSSPGAPLNNTYTLGYDALGRCVRRTLNNFTTWYIYDGEKPILEFNQDGQLAKNVYGKGIDEILMRTDPTVNGGAAFYYQQDHEGSVTHLTNAVGNKIEQYRYDVFGGPFVYDGSGNPRPNGTAYKNRFLFTGREYMNTFGFYEYRARAYHPGLGRFMSEDHKLGDTGDYNLFRYCHNDPIDFTDPLGLWEWSDVAEATYSFFTAGGRATFDAQSKYGDTTGKFAVQQGKQATRDYGLNPQAGEAVRHEVWQSELARKHGEYNARKIGDAHEIFKSKDAQDSKRDQYHNELGRENAKTSRSRDDSLQKAKHDWESGRAAKDKFDPRIEKGNETKADARTQKPPDASSVEQGAIEQGKDKAKEHSSNMIHSKPDPNPQ